MVVMSLLALSTASDMATTKTNRLTWAALLLPFLSLSVFALDFELPDKQDQFQSSSQWLGKPTFVFVWKTDCPACQQELPDINAFAQSRPDANLILITTDSWQESSPKLSNLPNNIALLRSVNAETLLRRLGNKTAAVPYTLVLTPQHEVCQKHLGAITRNELTVALANCVTSH
jgi:thiol-disulfide isomerase/thioredoxin